jgi:hypothetical protein
MRLKELYFPSSCLDAVEVAVSGSAGRTSQSRTGAPPADRGSEVDAMSSVDQPPTPAGVEPAKPSPVAGGGGLVAPAAAAPGTAPASAMRWTMLALALPASVLIAGWFLQPQWGWLVIMSLLATFIVLAGRRIVGPWRGAFVDERNKVSLSRFQTVVWTVLIVAAFLAAALHNIRSNQTDPLRIELPPQLWALLGISATSLVGSGLVKQEKAKRTPDLDNAKKSLAATGVPADAVAPAPGNQLVAAADPAAPSLDDPVVARGTLTVNETPDASSWADMFQGEEVGNAGHLDLGKIQMFYFTLVIVLAYAAALGSLLARASGKVTSFPALSDGTVALLGISHATYLTTKAVTRTPTTP